MPLANGIHAQSGLTSQLLLLRSMEKSFLSTLLQPPSFSLTLFYPPTSSVCRDKEGNPFSDVLLSVLSKQACNRKFVGSDLAVDESLEPDETCTRVICEDATGTGPQVQPGSIHGITQECLASHHCAVPMVIVDDNIFFLNIGCQG